MSKTEHLYSTLLEELNRTIKEKGIGPTIALLRNGRTSVAEDKDIQFVVVAVCNQVGVELGTLINQQTANEQIRYAKGFIVFYLRTAFDVDWVIITRLLNHKDQSYLWRLMQMIKKLKEHLAVERDYFNHKAMLDQVIKDYKSKK